MNVNEKTEILCVDEEPVREDLPLVLEGLRTSTVSESYMDDGNASLRLFPDFAQQDSALLLELVKTLKLDFEPSVWAFGKWGKQRRSTGFYAPAHIKGYEFSRAIAMNKGMPQWMDVVIQAVNGTLETDFNAVLVNYYANGKEYISAHSDKESALDARTRSVAALTLGSPRLFRITELQNKKKKKLLDLRPAAGSLLVMSGDFQSRYYHEAPPQKGAGERWSLTFRHHRC